MFLQPSVFLDISSYAVKIQKIITVQDLTLCLDKMDTSGKIEIYQVYYRANQFVDCNRNIRIYIIAEINL